MQSLDEILKPISEPMKLVENHALLNLSTDIQLLTEIGKYIFKSGGKRIRPALLLFTNGIFGKIQDESCLAASVIEYIHTATLLHDDVVDNAELRRSRKTTNTIWGNEAAVLVGDYLFTISFQLIAKLNSIPLIQMLSDCTTMMAKGEILQLIRDYNSASLEEYYSIIEHKTASLIGASMKIGGFIGGADEKTQQTLHQIGKEIGYTFQIVDDALDYQLTNQEVGKDQGTDLKERKITLPLIHLLQNSSSVEKEKINQILNATTIEQENVQAVMEMMEEKKSISHSLSVAKSFAEKALEKLQQLPENPYRKSIENLVEYITQRKS